MRGVRGMAGTGVIVRLTIVRRIRASGRFIVLLGLIRGTRLIVLLRIVRGMEILGLDRRVTGTLAHVLLGMAMGTLVLVRRGMGMGIRVLVRRGMATRVRDPTSRVFSRRGRVIQVLGLLRSQSRRFSLRHSQGLLRRLGL